MVIGGTNIPEDKKTEPRYKNQSKLYLGTQSRLSVDFLIRKSLQQAEIEQQAEARAEMRDKAISEVVGRKFRPRSLLKRLKNPLERIKGINEEDHYKKILEMWNRLLTVYGHLDCYEDDTANVYHVLFDSNSEYILTGASDGLIKVFSRETGQVKASLKGHLIEITILALSSNNKYIASASENGHVRIWSFPECRCLAVLKNFEGKEITSLIFQEELDCFGNPSCYLVVTAPSMGLFIFKEEDLVDNGGVAVPNQKCLNLGERSVYRDQRVEFYFAEISKSGLLAAYGSSGFVYIWPQMSKIFKADGSIDYSPCKTFQGLKLPNKKSNVFLDWSTNSSFLVNYNETHASIAHLDPQENYKVSSVGSFSSDVTIHHRRRVGKSSVADLNDRFFAISFNLRSNSQTDDTILLTNLFVFDLHLRKLTHKITPEKTQVCMATNVNGLCFHPKYHHILASCDQEGQVVLWDCELGLARRVFSERGVHINFPLLNAQVWDCNFSPCGRYLAVSTAFGNFSLYGYGVPTKHQYPLNFSEFFEKDYEQVYLREEDLAVLDASGNDFYQRRDFGGTYGICGLGYRRTHNYKRLPELPTAASDSEEENQGKWKQSSAIKRSRSKGKNNSFGMFEGTQEPGRQLTRDQQLEWMHSEMEHAPALSFAFENHDIVVRQDQFKHTKYLKEQELPQKNKFIEEFFSARKEETEGEAVFGDGGQNIFDPYQGPQGSQFVGYTQNGLNDQNSPNNRNNTSSTRARTNNRSGNNRDESNAEFEWDKSESSMAYEEDEEEDLDEQELLSSGSDEIDFDSESPLPVQRHSRRLRNRQLQTIAQRRLQNQQRQIRTRRRTSRRLGLRNNANNYARRSRPGRRDSLQAFLQSEDFDDSINHEDLLTKRRRRSRDPFLSEFDDQLEGYLSERNRRLKRLKISEELPTIEEDRVCTRCGDMGARVECGDPDCVKVFHLACAELRGYANRGVWKCFECIRDKYLEDDKTIEYNHAELETTWISSNYQDIDMISPQVGDVYYFVNAAYERFVASFFDILNFERNDLIWPVDQVPGIRSAPDGFKCVLKSIDYEWPKVRNHSILKKHRKSLTVLTKLTLAASSDQSQVFQVRYFPCETSDGSFLVWYQFYESKLEQFNKTSIYSQVKSISNEDVFHIEDKGSGGHNRLYKCIKAKPLIEGEILTRGLSRRTGDDDSTYSYFSPWEVNYVIVVKGKRSKMDFQKQDLQEFLPCYPQSKHHSVAFQRLIELICEKFVGEVVEFVKDVDRDEYDDYIQFVQNEVNLRRVHERLQVDYYRSWESLLWDFEMIERNCRSYNVLSSDIVAKAGLVHEFLKLVFEGLKSRLDTSPKLLELLRKLGEAEARRKSSDISRHSIEPRIIAVEDDEADLDKIYKNTIERVIEEIFDSRDAKKILVRLQEYRNDVEDPESFRIVQNNSEKPHKRSREARQSKRSPLEQDLYQPQYKPNNRRQRLRRLKEEPRDEINVDEVSKTKIHVISEDDDDHNLRTTQNRTMRNRDDQMEIIDIDSKNRRDGRHAAQPSRTSGNQRGARTLRRSKRLQKNSQITALEARRNGHPTEVRITRRSTRARNGENRNQQRAARANKRSRRTERRRKRARYEDDEDFVINERKRDRDLGSFVVEDDEEEDFGYEEDDDFGGVGGGSGLDTKNTPMKKRTRSSNKKMDRFIARHEEDDYRIEEDDEEEEDSRFEQPSEHEQDDDDDEEFSGLDEEDQDEEFALKPRTRRNRAKNHYI